VNIELRLAFAALNLTLGLACGGGTYTGHDPFEDKDGNTVLSSPGRTLRIIEVGEKDVFWVSGTRSKSRLFAVSKTGGPTRLLGKPGHNVEALVADQTHVYVATWSGIHRFEIGTGRKERITQYDGELLQVRAMLMHGEELWFTTKTALYKVPKTGAKPSKIADLETEDSWGWGLATDGELLYFSNRLRVGRIPLAGGDPETLHPKGQLIERSPIFIQGGYIYVDSSVGDGYRIPIEGGEPKKPCKYKHHNKGFAVDGDEWYYGASISHGGGYSEQRGGRRVYKTTNPSRGTGGVMRCRISSSEEPENLAPSALSVLSIDVDDTHVYWIDEEQGIVSRKTR
jgi:hypothetical protein